MFVQADEHHTQKRKSPVRKPNVIKLVALPGGQTKEKREHPRQATVLDTLLFQFGHDKKAD